MWPEILVWIYGLGVAAGFALSWIVGGSDFTARVFHPWWWPLGWFVVLILAFTKPDALERWRES